MFFSIYKEIIQEYRFLFVKLIESFVFQHAGLRAGDFIVAVGDIDVKWKKHSEIVELMRKTGDFSLNLRIITPMNQDFLASCGTSVAPSLDDSLINYTSTSPSGAETLPRRNRAKNKTSSSMWTLRKKRSASNKRTNEV